MPDLSAKNLVPILLKILWLEIGNEGGKDDERKEKKKWKCIETELMCAFVTPSFHFGL